MNKKIKNILSVIVLLLLIGFLIFYIQANVSDFQKLKFENPFLIFFIIAILVFNYVLIASVTKNLILPLGVRLKNLEVYAISVVTGFYNLITPFRGGAITRAVYLKKRHDFSYTKFLSSLAASYVLGFLIASLIGLISLFLINYYYSYFSYILLFVYLVFFIPLLFIVLFSPKFPQTRYRFINHFVNILNGWHLIKNNKKTIFIVSAINIFQILLGALSNLLAFSVFGVEITYIQALFLASLGTLSLLIAITPSGLGISEAVMVFSALVIGISPVQSISASLLGRFVSVVVLFILGPIFSYYLIKHKPKLGKLNQNQGKRIGVRR